jgi:hypothetical protein
MAAFLSLFRVVEIFGYLAGDPNWMRLHEVHRIGQAKSMAGASHPGELIGLPPRPVARTCAE